MRIKVLTVCLMISVSINLAFSTDLIIDKNVTLKKGIYKDLNEFKYNNPSIGMDYEIMSKEKGYGFLNSTTNNTAC